MPTYRAAVVGCSRMGAFIDHEIPLRSLPPMEAKADEPISTLGIAMRLKSPTMLPCESPSPTRDQPPPPSPDFR